jgi:hypothetical protein
VAAGVFDDRGGLHYGGGVEEHGFGVFGSEGGTCFGGTGLEEDGGSLGRGIDLIAVGEFQVFSCDTSQCWSHAHISKVELGHIGTLDLLFGSTER